jgi:hypothetical protein
MVFRHFIPQDQVFPDLLSRPLLLGWRRTKYRPVKQTLNFQRPRGSFPDRQPALPAPFFPNRTIQEGILMNFTTVILIIFFAIPSLANVPKNQTREFMSSTYLEKGIGRLIEMTPPKV